MSVTHARSAWQRTVGLIGRRHVAAGDGMFFERCSSIHTFFMRMAIDVLFLDEQGRVVRAVPGVRPWRPYVGCSRAASVVEMAAGEIARRGIATGDAVRFTP